MLKNVKVLIQICFIRYNNYIFVHIIETLIFNTNYYDDYRENP